MHIPVLQKEVIKYLDPKPNENFVDCTIGQGGHAKEILKLIAPHGKVLGIDWDENQIDNCKKELVEFKDRLILVNSSYINLKEIVKKNHFKPVHGILFDLGMSSWQLEEAGRGFTFMKNEPLDMRYSTENQKSKIKNQKFLTAEKIINEYSFNEIEKILRECGEERFAARIARKIIEERKIQPIKTTFQLAEIIKKAVLYSYQKKRISPATKTFQALRIAVNDELNNLKRALPQVIEVLEPGGRIVVISFHSLEDRIVKNFFREKTKTGVIYPVKSASQSEAVSRQTGQFNRVKILIPMAKPSRTLDKIGAKKPITASPEEIKLNPRARSAKLRVAIKN